MGESDFDESKANEALKLIEKLGSVSLHKYRVVGNYVRYDPKDRNLLFDIRDKIVSRLKERNVGQEIYLIWGTSGSGKTTFIEELGKSISDFAFFKKLILSDLDEKTFREELAKLQEEKQPLLCLIDEVDSKLSESWPDEAMITPLEKPLRASNTCFVLAGSGGNNVKELEALIRSRHSPGEKGKGKDILRRVTFKCGYEVPAMSLADRMLIGLCHLTQAAGKRFLWVEKPVLLYIALNRRLDKPSKIHDLAVSCAGRILAEQNRVMYDHLFQYGDKERDQFRDMWKDKNLAGSYIWVEDDQAQPMRVIYDTTVKTEVFRSVEEEFGYVIRKNFLHDFDKSGNPDYSQLLSPDFRDWFLHNFDRYDTLCITGRKGVGKTFSCMLLGRELEKKGFRVFYASLAKKELSEKAFANFTSKGFVFILDDCHEDTELTERVYKELYRLSQRGISHKVIFLFQSEQTKLLKIQKIFGEDVPILFFRLRFVDLVAFTKLFFRKINRIQDADRFLSLVKKSDLSHAFEYKNMAFWNMFFRVMKKELERGEINLSKGRFYDLLERFLEEEARYLVENKAVLVKLLPFFKNGLPIHADYAYKTLNISSSQFEILKKEDVIYLCQRDWDRGWDNARAEFIRTNLHPTEAEILWDLFGTDEGLLDEKETLLNYADKNYSNLYHIIEPMSFVNPKLLKDLCGDDRFRSVVRRYLKERHLGKCLDRVVWSLSVLPPQLKEKLIDDEIIDEWSKKCSNSKVWLVSKVGLLGRLYKFSPFRAYELYRKLEIEKLISDFNELAENEKGAHVFKRLIGFLKNLYLFYLFGIDPKFKEEMELGTVSEKLRAIFAKHNYPLGLDKPRIGKLGSGEWIIDDEGTTYLVKEGAKEGVLDVYALTDDRRERETRVASSAREILEGCYERFIKIFEKYEYHFSVFHRLLLNLDVINVDSQGTLATYFLEKIPPQEIVSWIRCKDTCIGDLKYLIKNSKHSHIETDATRKSYYDFFKESLNYGDIMKLFDNKRSDLYEITRTSSLYPDFLANHLDKYSQEKSFAEKTSSTVNPRAIRDSIRFVSDNSGLSSSQKDSIIRRITENVDVNKTMKYTMRKARRQSRNLLERAADSTAY